VFAALCEAHGVTFIGPPAHAMHLMGKKTPAKAAMRAAGLA
jgi:acetyl-CoA carboxylase biotin carboxylase subunit